MRFEAGLAPEIFIIGVHPNAHSKVLLWLPKRPLSCQILLRLISAAYATIRGLMLRSLPR